MTSVKTTYYPSIFDEKTSECIYLYLKNNINWQDGIYSKKHKVVSRKAYMPTQTTDIDDYINQLVATALPQDEDIDIQVLGIYVNYYQNGNDFCPAHSHSGTTQMILSFGATRKLTVGKKEFPLKSGDVIIFGSSTHKIDKEPEITEGRISIAVFINKL